MNLRAPAALAVLALTLAGCGSGGDNPPAPATGSNVVPVVATTDVYGSIANAVGGTHIKVTSVINSPDADPHEYESTPADVKSVGEAKVLIANGGGYDDFAGRLAQASGGNPTTIDVSQLSGLNQGGEFNEHVWYHLPTMAKLADQLATDLGRIDPANAAAYQTNAAAFRGQLDGLTNKINATVKAQHQGTRVAVTEPVPLYLVEAAGLSDATPEEFSHAIEEGNDPPAAVLNETLALFKGPDAVRALLVNAQTESASTEQVEHAATGAAVPIVRVTETLPAGTIDYVTWMGAQIDQLASAMDRQ